MFQLTIPPNAISAENKQCKQGGKCSSIERGIKPVDRDSVRRANREKALKAISTPAHQVVLWGSETPSAVPYTYGLKEQTLEELNERIIKEVNNRLAVTKEPLIKDEFETTQAFELRQKEYDKQYNKKVKSRESQLEQERPAIYAEGLNDILGAPVLDKVDYDADLETFNLSISASQADYVINAKIRTPLADAKEMKAKIESMKPWVAFQIDGEKVIPKSVILQNKDGAASSIKRLDFTGRQENQALSIGYITYAAILSAKKQTEEKIAREEQEKAAQMAQEEQEKAEQQNREKQLARERRKADTSGMVNKIWTAYTTHPGNVDHRIRYVNISGQIVKDGTVPPTAVGSSVEGRLPAFLACYDFVMVMSGLGDDKADMCIYYIDNPTRGTYAIMWRGKQYLGQLENKMANDGFTED